MNVLLVNYGTSNIFSIYNSLKKMKKVKIYINEFTKNQKIDKIIFPGQGHIANSINFVKLIPNFYNLINNTHILGICIGYHIFFENSEEDENYICLQHYKEKIVKLGFNCCKQYILPNIGWFSVKLIKKHKIFNNIPNKFSQYFMNSYSSLFLNQKVSFAYSKTNNFKFNSIIIDENKFLFQFHPEKSGKIGLKLLQNFLEL